MSHAKTAFAFLAPVLLTLPAGAADADRTPGEVYQRALQATAWVHTLKRQGTGWLADADRRLVVTNYHVVGTDESVTVIFPDTRDGKLIAESRYYKENEPALLRKGRAVQGRVTAADPKRDLALVRLDSLPNGVVPLRMARTAPQPSDRVHSVGNPGASDAFWVYTTGTVRQVYHNRFQYQDGQQVEAQVIETQAPLNPGDSGGPVVNDRGEVVGVNAAGKANAQLVSLCIDVSEVRALLDGLQSAPPRAPAPGGSREPSAPECNNRGVDFCAQELYDKAIREFNKALRLNPYYTLAYKNRAIAYLRVGAALAGRSRPYFQLSLSDYNIVLQLDPKDADAYRQRGLVHARIGDADKAVADFTQALKIKPDFPEAYRGRSQAYRDLGDIDHAVADLEQAIKLQGK